MQDITVPEILRCNLAGVILSLKAIGIEDVSAVDFMDKPHMRAFLASFQTLIKLGALCPKTASLTEMGREMAILPTEPIYSRLLVTSLKPEYQAVRESIAAIVAMLSVENVFYQASGAEVDKTKAKAIKRRSTILHPSSDHLSLLNIFMTYKSLSSTQKHSYCNEYLLNNKALLKASQIHNQLVGYLD